MKTSFYFPAPVEVVKVTNENLAEVAVWCGGRVAATESRRVAGRMDSYVWVPTPKGSSVSWAFPGMFITKRMVVTVKDEMKATFAVFRRDYFSRNYFDTPTEATDKTWEKFEKQKAKENSAPKAAPKPRATYKSKAEIEQNKQIDAIHGPGASDALSAAFADGSIFNDNNQKENDMEQSKHGYPVLTEEEAIQRKEAAGIETEVTPEQGLENVKTILGGEEVVQEIDEDGKCGPECDGGHPVDGGDFNDPSGSAFIGDAFAGGQVLEGGEIAQAPSADS